MIHEWWAMPSMPRALLSTQLIAPYWESNSHCHTVIEASTGVPHASSRETCSVMRAAAPTRAMRTANAMPITIVTAALTRQKAMERPMTAHT